MSDLTATQPLPNRNSAVDRPACQPLAGSMSTVTPPRMSAVTQPQVNREQTAELRLQVDSQVDLTAQTSNLQEDFAGSTSAERSAASMSPAATTLASAVSSAVKDKATPLELYPMRPKGTVVKREQPAAPLPKEPSPVPQTPSRPAGTVTKGHAEVPNWVCYREAFKGLVDEHGNWLGKGKVPKCRVCGGNLQPQENHKCSGYVPELPYEDYAGHIERMKEQREEHHEAIAEMRKHDKQDRLRKCKRCGGQVSPDDEHQCERLQCEDCGEWVTQDECHEHDESCRGYVKL